MSITCILFDLDTTLYPAGKGLMQAISARIPQYLVAHLDLSGAGADTLRHDHYLRFGSFMCPLATDHHPDVADFLGYAHDIDVEGVLAPDADLGCSLQCAQATKVIFANAPRADADRVLRRLDLAPQFDRMFDYEFGDYLRTKFASKPDAAVYRKLQDALNAPTDTILGVDDAMKNLAPARELGWKMIWVNVNGALSDGAVDFVVRDLWQIADAFHQLGVMDPKHRVMVEHRLARYVWAERREWA